jgi:protein-S-isoprenylcysteine O-methyltransferase Ste14
MPHDQLDELWARPTSWKWGGVYCCKDDPRAIVPKRIKWMGWTINFAHWYAWVALVLLPLALVAPLLAEMALGVTSPAVIVPTGLASVIAVCIAAHVASRAR